MERLPHLSLDEGAGGGRKDVAGEPLFVWERKNANESKKIDRDAGK